MTTLTIYPESGPAFVAWADGVPSIPAALASEADELIRRRARMGLTAEGPYVKPGWETQASAAVLLVELYPNAQIGGSPSLAPLYARPRGAV